MKFKNVLTAVTLCALTLAASVSANDRQSCGRPGMRPGLTAGWGFGIGLTPGGWNGGGWNGGSGAIQVLSAFYGVNCGVHHNVGWSVQSMCSGQQTCWYRVDHNMLGDPAYGCRKDFRVDYTCGDGQARQAYLGGEASGQTLQLACY